MSEIIEQVESILFDLHPELRERGAVVPESELDRLQAIFPAPLPPFYRWFLRRFGGGDMGPLKYVTLDFSIQGLLTAHEDELPNPEEDPEEYAAELVQDPCWCMIAYSLNLPMPSLYYDLKHQVRDDARVKLGGSPRWDTLYEMLLWNTSHWDLLPRFAQCRSATVRSNDGQVTQKMAALAQSWGFSSRIPTDTRMMLLTRPDAAILWRKSFDNDTTLRFELASNTRGLDRQILGELAMSDDLTLIGADGRPLSRR